MFNVGDILLIKPGEYDHESDIYAATTINRADYFAEDILLSASDLNGAVVELCAKANNGNFIVYLPLPKVFKSCTRQRFIKINV